MANDMVLGVQHLIPVGTRDLLTDDNEPKYAKGQVTFVRDAFGVRIFKYLHNKIGSATTAGQLVSRAANATISNATSGSTTTVTKTGAGWAASSVQRSRQHGHGYHRRQQAAVHGRHRGQRRLHDLLAVRLHRRGRRRSRDQR